MPPAILAVISIVQLAIKAAPQAVEVYNKARELFKMWFDGGFITKAQQDELRSWADRHEAATLAGEVPPEFQIEPDPQ